PVAHRERSDGSYRRGDVAEPVRGHSRKLDQILVGDHPDDSERGPQPHAAMHLSAGGIDTVHRPLQPGLVDAEREDRKAPEVCAARCRGVAAGFDADDDAPRHESCPGHTSMVCTNLPLADPHRRTWHTPPKVPVEDDDAHLDSARWVGAVLRTRLRAL